MNLAERLWDRLVRATPDMPPLLRVYLVGVIGVALVALLIWGVRAL